MRWTAIGRPREVKEKGGGQSCCALCPPHPIGRDRKCAKPPLGFTLSALFLHPVQGVRWQKVRTERAQAGGSVTSWCSAQQHRSRLGETRTPSCAVLITRFAMRP